MDKLYIIFPEQMFFKEGIFKGFIGLLDDSDDGGHTHLTGVNIWFRVLGGVAQMVGPVISILAT